MKNEGPRDKNFLKPSLVNWISIHDNRGVLSIIDKTSDLPFNPKRIFLQHSMRRGETRGGHAHLECEQVIFLLSGACTLKVTNSVGDFTFELNPFQDGVYIPKLSWATEFFPLENSILLVLASESYDEKDYIRDFKSFTELILK